MSVSHIGSVFLGDVQRQRLLSSSTPPSSPPPHIGTSSSPSPLQMAFIPEHSVADLDIDLVESPVAAAPSITPEMSIALRLRWLETLLFGSRPSAQENRNSSAADVRNNANLRRGVEDLQRRLEAVVQNSEGLKRFIDHCMLLNALYSVWLMFPL